MSRRIHSLFSMKTVSIVLAALLPVYGAYTYYRTDTFSTINTTNWQQNGTISAQSGGVALTSTAANGGSLISKVAVPNGGVDGEVRTVLSLTSTGGNIVHYHRASADALSAPSSAASAGSYIAVKLAGVTFTSGVCSATVVVEQRVGGVVTTLASAPFGCQANSVFRTVIRPSPNTLYVLIDEALVFSVSGTSFPATGSPGVGAWACGAGTGIAEADLGALDTVLPGAIPANSLSYTPYANEVQLQWSGAVDDAAGIGLNGYMVLRNGSLFATTPGTTWIDSTAQPGTTYSYAVLPYDRHFNLGPSISAQVITPAAGGINPRQIGVRKNGSYYGAAGENIDLQSGNLNLTIPLVRPTGRSGVAAAVNLVYNSQLWRKDNGGIWKLGSDVGFGFGWRLLVASVTPVYSGIWHLDHYNYNDSTGAEYHLYQQPNGLWQSTESIYATFDDKKNWLMFPDGTFYEMNVVSQGTEVDAGTRYPTRAIDTNGNYISFSYMAGTLATSPNSSSRLVSAQDPRQTGTTPAYAFTYDTQPLPHLTNVTNSIGTSETFSLSYTSLTGLTEPFNQVQAFGSASLLTAVQNTNLNTIHGLGYASFGTGLGSGEVTQYTFPYGGGLIWTYSPYTNQAGMTVREIASRAIQPGSSFGSWNYSLGYDPADSGRMMHSWRSVANTDGNGLRYYSFQTNMASPYAGFLISLREATADASQTPRRDTFYGWASDPLGNPYIAQTAITLDPGQTYAVTSQSQQVVGANGAYGQVTSQAQFAFGNSTTPSRTSTMAYTQITGGLTPMWRLTSVTSQDGLVSTNTYDQSGITYSAAPGITFHDSSLFGGSTAELTAPRGNLITTHQTIGADVRTYTYTRDISGGVVTTTAQGTVAGRASLPAVLQTITPDSTNGRYMAPATVKPNNNTALSGTFQYNSPFAGLTNAIAPNNASTTITYDTNARPSSVTSPDGATTTYTYSANPPQSTATTNNHWTRTTTDGLGRTIMVENGTLSGGTPTTVSIVQTGYSPCGCTPAGALSGFSRPYAPGAAQWYTTFSVVGTDIPGDPLCRPVQIHLAGDPSPTTYAYQGNTVTVTDPTGRWKKLTTDAFGNTIQVNEPNPAGGADYVTTYTYNNFDKLTQVSMPRTMPGSTVVTQTRTFVYDSTQQLASVTQPESGTTSYTYDTAGHTKTKTDAKGNVVTYTYDTYDRVTQINRSPAAGSVEPDPVTTFSYDSPDTNTYLTQQNLAGRLAKVTHGFGSVERFSYTAAGRMAAKTLSPQDALPFIGSFTYNNEGQLTGYTPSGIYNSGGTAIPQGTRQWSYDALGRPLGLTYYDANNVSTALTANASYNAANQITSYVRAAVLQYNAGNDLAGVYQSETLNFSYNITGRIIQQSGGTWAPTIQYQYSTTATDGRLQGRVDQYAGGTTATSSYAYDSLGRLTSASATGGLVWGQAYVYDPFGNLLQQNVTSGSAPALNITVNPGTNRISTTGFTYDVSGNLIQSPTGASPNTYSYDSQNRMTRASYAGGAPINYYYGASGERLYDGARWHFYGPDGTHLETLTPNGAGGTFGSTVEELHFAGRLVFQDYYPVVTDRLGSVVQMGKGNGAINQGYFPFGQAISGVPQPANSAPPNYGTVTYPSSGSVSDVAFGTYHRDGFGLDYALNRYYDFGRGRLASPDPFGGSGKTSIPLSWNRYSYVNGDPVNSTDPLGLDGEDIEDGGCITCIKPYLPSEPIGSSGGGGWSVVLNAIDLGPGTATFSTTGCASGPCEKPLYGPYGSGLSVFDQINAMNPGGFINAGAAVEAGSLLVGAAVGTIIGATSAAVVEETSSVVISSPEVSSPSFLGQADGPAIPVPEGATGPTTAANGQGSVFSGGQGGNGLAPNVTDVRVMDPTPGNPNGYVNYGSAQQNGGWQSVQPYRGVPIGKADPWWHIPLGRQTPLR